MDIGFPYAEVCLIKLRVEWREVKAALEWFLPRREL
jgi:hypothetical protein